MMILFSECTLMTWYHKEVEAKYMVRAKDKWALESFYPNIHLQCPYNDEARQSNAMVMDTAISTIEWVGIYFEDM